MQNVKNKTKNKQKQNKTNKTRNRFSRYDFEKKWNAFR